MFPNNNNNNRNNIFDNNDPNSFNNNNPNLQNINSNNNFNFNPSPANFNLQNQFPNEINPLNQNNFPNSNNNNFNTNNNFQPAAENFGFRSNFNPNALQQDLNNSMPAGGFNMNQLGFGILNRANPQNFNYQNMPGFQNNNLNNNNNNDLNNISNPMQQNPNSFNLPFGRPRGTVNLSQMGLDINAFNNMTNPNNFNNNNNNLNNLNNFNNLNQSVNSGGAQAQPMFYNTMRNDANFINRFLEMQNMQNMQNNMQNLNTQNEEETRLRQEEEMQRILEDEVEMQKLKDEMKNYLKSNKNIAYIKQDLFAIRRSEYFNERDRYFFEELIQLPLKTSGFLGLGNVLLDKNALFAEKSPGKMSVGYSKERNYFDKLSKDGVYLDYVKKKVYSYNIQKLEQRLLREGKFDWFRSNGDLKLETDIFDGLLTRPIDISLTTNDKFNLQTLSPQLCLRSTDRIVKKYRLKLFLAKIILQNHPIFNLEDKLCSELKELYNDYYQEMNKLQLPYIKEKINIINRRLDEYRKEKEQTEAQKLEIKNMKILVQEAIDFLNDAKKTINMKANSLYNKWIEIKNLRIAQKYSSSNLRLNVIKFPSSNRENPNVFDYAFILTTQEPTMDKLFLPIPENSRRENIKKIQAYLKIFVNGIYLGKTKTVFLNWPEYSLDIDSLFNLTVNTRPTRIHLELYVKNGWVYRKTCEIQINPPGIYMNTVTSSAVLHEEVWFDNAQDILGDEYFGSDYDRSRSSYKNKNNNDDSGKDLEHKYVRVQSNNLLNEINSPLNQNIEESSKLLAEDQKQPLAKDAFRPENSKAYISGKILYKTEWEGQAPDMPPTKIEDRLILYEKRTKQNPVQPFAITNQTETESRKNQMQQNLNNFNLNNYNNQENKKGSLWKSVKPDYPYDINDPRNVLVFEKIKKLKTELLLKYLYKEYMLPYYDIESIRQLILLKRVEKSSLRNVKIPILEKQIEADEQLQQVMQSLLKEKENLSKEELEKKIKIQLELLNKNHSGMILSDEEFYAFVNEKIKTLRKDVVNKVQYSYFQIINEYSYATDFWKIFANLMEDICEQDRRLKPKRKKKDDKKVDKCSAIKINVHVIKGYNIPIRFNSKTNSYIEKRRDELVKNVYRRVVGNRSNAGFNFNLKNWFGGRNNNPGNMSGNRSLSMGNFGQAGFMNPNANMGNMNMMGPMGGMAGMNMPMTGMNMNMPPAGLNANNFQGGFLTNNNFGPASAAVAAAAATNNFNNNSQLFNNAGTVNNSYNDVNLNIGAMAGIAGTRGLNNDFNNLNMPFPINPNLNNSLNRISNPNLAPNSNQIFNPNINNIMGNPNTTGFMPAYNMPNMYMKNDQIQGDELVYDGDIIRMVEQLRSMERNVQSFVEVKLAYYDQKFSIRTDSIDGVHPDYNYKIQFQIKPKDEEEFFSKEELHRSNGGLYFTLYDEVRTEDIVQEKDANTYIYKYEKKYLGSLFLPFATIFQNASLLETVSKINVPMTVFSYYSDTSTAFDVQSKKEEDMRRQTNFAQMNANVNNPNPNLNPNVNASQNSFFNNFKDGQLKIINPAINTYLSLYITLDPIMNVFKAEDVDYIPGFEDSTFLINTTKWLKNIKDDFLLKNRYIKLFGENFDGYSVFIPRFLKPQKPPEIVFDILNNTNDDLAIEKAARYVSLIPFVEDCQAFDDDISDCWCTDDQFLSLGFGDYEEHAILLCNYFNYIDKAQNRNVCSYLCLGKAYPEGQTTYVARICQSSPDVELWNAKTGECYYFDKRYKSTTFLGISVIKSFANSKAMGVDDMCQMKEIGCVISDGNVYVNIQEQADPGLIAFDLKDEKCWKPFLNDKSRRKYFPQGIKTIQTELTYEYPTSEESFLLKEKIFNHLKREIEVTRACQTVKGKPLRTKWDSIATDTIETLLSDYDSIHMTTKRSAINAILTGQDLLIQKKQTEDEVLNKLFNIQTQINNCIIDVKEIYGFPMNQSFTSIKNIWEQVKLTDIHMTCDEDNELNLSVHVNGYPNKIFSVWIFFSVFKKY